MTAVAGQAGSSSLSTAWRTVTSAVEEALAAGIRDGLFAQGTVDAIARIEDAREDAAGPIYAELDRRTADELRRAVWRRRKALRAPSADEHSRAHDIPPDDPLEIDLKALTGTPAAPAFIVPDWLPAGEVTLLAAHGGVGKSATALHLAVCLALGRDFHGLQVQQRDVDIVSFEDTAAVLHWRLSRICAVLDARVIDLAGRLRLLDGTACVTPWYGRMEYGSTGPTGAFHAIADRIGGAGRVVIVDGSADVYGGDENDRAQVKAFIRLLRRLIAPDGALLLLAHVDKAAAKSGANALGFSGSTGWNNGVRCRWFMYGETDEQDGETGSIVLEVRKANLGRTGARMVLTFDEPTGTFRRSDVAQVDRPGQRVGEAEAILRTIREAHQAGDPVPASASGARTAHSVCEARPDFPASLRGRRGRTRFYRALEELRAAGAVRVESVRRANRHFAEVLCTRD